MDYHFPPPEDLPNPGIKPASPVSPALQVDSLLAEPSEKPCVCVWKLINSAYSSDSKHSAYSLQKFLENVVSHRFFFSLITMISTPKHNYFHFNVYLSNFSSSLYKQTFAQIYPFAELGS